MSLPKDITVGELLDYLKESLAKEEISRETGVLIEMYVLSKEDERLKPIEDELGYHIPDDIADDCFNFHIGTWSGSPNPKDDGSAWVALSCYMGQSSLKRIVKSKIE